jgi:hypothetical protein
LLRIKKEGKRRLRFKTKREIQIENIIEKKKGFS